MMIVGCWWSGRYFFSLHCECTHACMHKSEYKIQPKNQQHHLTAAKGASKMQTTTTTKRIMPKNKTAYCCLILLLWALRIEIFRLSLFFCVCILCSIDNAIFFPLYFEFFQMKYGQEKSNIFSMAKERPWQANIHSHARTHKIKIINRMSYYIPSIYNIVIYYFIWFHFSFLLGEFVSFCQSRSFFSLLLDRLADQLFGSISHCILFFLFFHTK